jgi:hypothetical protein
MYATYPDGSYSHYPRQTYCPADLAPAEQVSFRIRLVRAAAWFGMGPDAAEEAASEWYMYWLTRDYRRTDIPRGDHHRAVCAAIDAAKRARWHGHRPGRHRAAEPALTARLRRRCEMMMGPEMPVIAEDCRRADSPTGRKISRLANRLGIPAGEVLAMACGRGAE